MAGVDQDAVQALVARITSSAGFIKSERLCRFLRFTVDGWLTGEGDHIKEYLIGREVFDRDGEYDPRTDPIVRVEARRLRKKLEEYYATSGRDEPLKIWYPPGSYVPQILQPQPAAVNEVVGRRKWLLSAPAALLVAGLGFWIIQRPALPKSKIIVLPARWVWKTEEFTQTPIDVDLAERVAAELANRHGVSVVAWPVVQSHAARESKTNEIARQLGASRTLLIAVRVEAAGTRVTAFLMDNLTDRKIQVVDREGLDLSTSGQRQHIATAVATEIAAPLH